MLTELCPAPGITVTPAGVRLSLGGTVQFAVTPVGDLDPAGVVWTAVGDTVTADGLFTAGSGVGESR